MSITLVIIIVTGLISYQCFSDRNLKSKLAHYPVAEAGNGEYYRLFTGGLVRADMNHLLINMFVLYFFGEAIEREFDDLFDGILGKVHFVMIPIYAVLAGFLFLAWESYAGKKQIGRTDHDGHFYGALFGVLYIIAFKPSVVVEFLKAMIAPPFL